jgi:hypothetical protein
MAAELSDLSREEYLSDKKLVLVFEALVLRVGEPWSSAAKARDIVAHHYHRIDSVAPFETLKRSFPQLRQALSELEQTG